MEIQQPDNLCRVMKRADLLKAILESKVETDRQTLRRHVPEKIRRADWWQRTTDEQKARVIRSVIYLKLKGFSDADVAELRSAVFRMFTMGTAPDPKKRLVWATAAATDSNVTPIVQRRSPNNRALREKIDRLKRDKGLERFSREELLALATHDELTGLPNRHAYGIARKRPVVAMADVEGLKWINDNLGHKAGDELLVRTADLMCEEGFEAYRMGKGADEFVVQFETVEDADQSLARVNEALRRSSFESAGREISGFQLTWGIGPDLETADQRMNAAKTELKQVGLRARRGDKPAAFQESSEGNVVEHVPAEAKTSAVEMAKIVNLRQDTLASHPSVSSPRRRSA